MPAAPLPRRLFAEFLASAFLTADGLFTFILMFGPVSGGHFNPVVPPRPNKLSNSVPEVGLEPTSP